MIDNNRPIIIYISAASDLMTEREALALMIAKLPVSLAWRVVQTPLGEEQLETTLLSTADLHLLIMGGDIRAPVGLELYTVREAGRPTVAFLKQGLARTTAGEIFTRQANVAWQPFLKAADLSRLVQRVLVEHLLRQALTYLLSPTEVEQLERLLTTAAVPDQDNSPGAEAGRSAIILSRDRYTPSEGVIVNDVGLGESGAIFGAAPACAVRCAASRLYFYRPNAPKTLRIGSPCGPAVLAAVTLMIANRAIIYLRCG